MKIKILSILLLLLASLTSFGQTKYLEDINDRVTGEGVANGGEYTYRATVKAQTYLPGLKDVRIKFAIMEYEITSFTYKGINADNLDGVDFPIRLNKIQSDLIFVRYGYRNNGRFLYVDGTELGLSNSFIDFYDLTPEEIADLRRIFNINKAADFSNILVIELETAELKNSYFDELSKIASLIDLKIAQGELQEKIKKDALDAETLRKEKHDKAETLRQEEHAKWVEEQESKAELSLKIAESEARIETEAREAKEEKRAYDNQFKSESQLKHERDVNDWYNVLAPLQDINIRDADLESGSWGLAYSLNYFNDLSISYAHVSGWNNFFLIFDFKGTMLSFDAYEPETDSDNPSELFHSGGVHAGDILFTDYRTDNSSSIDRVYHKNKIQSFGWGLGFGMGLRFNVSRSTAIRVLAMADITSGTNISMTYGYGFKTQLEIARLILGVGFNTTTYSFRSVSGIKDYRNLDLERIVIGNQLDDNSEENDWASPNGYNVNGEEISFYRTNHTSVENSAFFNKITQQYMQLYIAFKL